VKKPLVSRLVGVVLLSLLAGSAYTAATIPEEAERAAETIAADDLRAHLRFLASDELGGRGTGHGGNQVAELYLAAVFERLGLGRAAGAAYLQPVEMYFTTLGPGNELVISEQVNRAQVAVRYAAGTDFQPHSASGSRTVTAELFVAGYGITAPDLQYDDYAGLDARGRIVIVLEGEPRTDGPGDRFRGRASTSYAAVEHKIQNARAHGAAGLLIVRNRLRDVRAAWPEQPSVRARHFELASAVDEQTLAIGTISIGAADQLIAAGRADGGQNVSAVRKDVEGALERAGREPVSAPASFAIPGREARLSIDLSRQRAVMHNVLAMIEGADPTLKNELVVIGAHLDHDGIDDDGRVYNGADDDGSGTVAVLEAAEAYTEAARAGRRPARTVVFALWNGEEKGLLGSRHYVANPVPAGHTIVANINLDMVGRDEDVPDPKDFRFFGLPKTAAAENTNAVHLIGYSYSPKFARIVSEENAAVGLTVKQTLDDSPTNLIRRSDHWSFLSRQIPAIFLTSGLHPDYHTPQDDVGRINFEKLEKIARLAYRVSWRVASDAVPPDYVDPAPIAKASSTR
jgi:hypothetical protein